MINDKEKEVKKPGDSKPETKKPDELFWEELERAAAGGGNNLPTESIGLNYEHYKN